MQIRGQLLVQDYTTTERDLGDMLTVYPSMEAHSGTSGEGMIVFQAKCRNQCMY